jgi:hypothetical protein
MIPGPGGTTTRCLASVVDSGTTAPNTPMASSNLIVVFISSLQSSRHFLAWLPGFSVVAERYR